MSIIRQVPWTVQPQYSSGINRAHPVGKDVLAYFNAGESLRFGSSFPTTIGGTQSIGKAGRCIDYASTKTQYPVQSRIASACATSAGCSVLLVFDVDTLTNYGCLISLQNTSVASNTIEIRVGYLATDSFIMTGRNKAGGTSTPQFATSANQIAAGDKRIRLLVSWPDQLVQSAPTYYLNGISLTPTFKVGTDTGNVGAATTNGLCLGGRSADTVTPLDGRIYNAWLIGRAVTAAEGITLTQTPSSPYALFASQPIDIWVPSAGGTTYTLSADSGAFALSGTAATLKLNRSLSAESGSFALTGTAASIKANRLLSAASGTFALAGADATLKANRAITAASGSFALTGTAATLTYNPVGGPTYTLAAASGNVALTGTDAALTSHRRLTADSGTFALTGTAASIRANHVLAADAGSIVLAGAAAALTYSGAGETTLTAADLAAIADEVWAHPEAVGAHATLDSILTILQAG